ncbi:hypothetical protein [Vibrio taketomensis]|uniref:hypothetical protein n=1 Tax=Vibrio taketomensis TaxID=2572923 RepID=UPI001E3EA68A|nr:hypothetical protein [Vibrio taketomensis]
MKFLSGQSNYDKFPNVTVKGFDHDAFRGWNHIVNTIKQRIQGQDKHILVVDTYHGVNHNELLDQLVAPLSPDLVISMDDAKHSEEHIFAMLERNITDDRVFGVLAPHKLEEFFDSEKLQGFKQKLATLIQVSSLLLVMVLD